MPASSMDDRHLDRLLDGRPAPDDDPVIAEIVRAVRSHHSRGPVPRAGAELTGWLRHGSDGMATQPPVGPYRSSLRHRRRRIGMTPAAVALTGLVLAVLGAASTLPGSTRDPMTSRPDQARSGTSDVIEARSIAERAQVEAFAADLDAWVTCVHDHLDGGDPLAICGPTPSPPDYGLLSVVDQATAHAAELQDQLAWVKAYGEAVSAWANCVPAQIVGALNSWQATRQPVSLDLDLACGPAPAPEDFTGGRPDSSPTGIDLPDIRLPPISIPDVTVPDISVPDVPDVSVPDVPVPDDIVGDGYPSGVLPPMAPAPASHDWPWDGFGQATEGGPSSEHGYPQAPAMGHLPPPP